MAVLKEKRTELTKCLQKLARKLPYKLYLETVLVIENTMLGICFGYEDDYLGWKFRDDARKIFKESKKEPAKIIKLQVIKGGRHD